MHCLEHGKGSTIMADDSSIKSRRKGGHGCFSSTPLSRESATHKHRRYGSNGHKQSYHRGFGTLRKKCCGTN